MTIGTSDGETFDDEFAHALSRYKMAPQKQEPLDQLFDELSTDPNFYGTQPSTDPNGNPLQAPRKPTGELFQDSGTRVAGSFDSQQEQPQTDPFTESLRQRFGTPPPALRAFATTLAGDRSPITENFFTPHELDILKNTAETQLAKGKKEIGYGDYGEIDPFIQGSDSIINALTHTPNSLAYTLGMARVNKESDGTIVIKDKYQFDARKSTVDKATTWDKLRFLVQGAMSNGLLGIGNVVGNMVLPAGSEDARPVEIRIPPK